MVDKSSETKSITAIILAGGQSSRMGQDKALISVNGQPLLQHTCILARRCADLVYVITPWPEKYQNLLPKDCHFILEKSESNITKSHGPLIGFAQALVKVETGWVLLLPCDLPFLELSELQKWCQLLNHTPREVMALLPQNHKGWDCLCGFYRRECLSSLQNYINHGGKAFQPWLTNILVHPLPVTNPRMLFNCNTPQDLVTMRAYEHKNYYRN